MRRLSAPGRAAARRPRAASGLSWPRPVPAATCGPAGPPPPSKAGCPRPRARPPGWRCPAACAWGAPPGPSAPHFCNHGVGLRPQQPELLPAPARPVVAGPQVPGQAQLVGGAPPASCRLQVASLRSSRAFFPRRPHLTRPPPPVKQKAVGGAPWQWPPPADMMGGSPRPPQKGRPPCPPTPAPTSPSPACAGPAGRWARPRASCGNCSRQRPTRCSSPRARSIRQLGGELRAAVEVEERLADVEQLLQERGKTRAFGRARLASNRAVYRIRAGDATGSCRAVSTGKTSGLA